MQNSRPANRDSRTLNEHLAVEDAAEMNGQITQLVQAFYDRIWNAGDTGAADELLAEDFAFRGSLGPEMRGRAAFCDYVQMVRAALDRYHCDILDCVTEGDRVFAKMRFSGIHVGPFRATHRPASPYNGLALRFFEPADR